MLKNFLNKNGQIFDIITKIESGQNANIFGLNLAEKCLIISSIKGHKLFLCENISEAKEAEILLAGYNEKCLSYYNCPDVANLNLQIAIKETEEEVNFLKQVYAGNYSTLILPITVLKDIYPNKAKLENLTFKIETNDKLDKTKLSAKLFEMGYSAVSEIDQVGQYFFAGDILYINMPNGYFRIEFFGNNIEAIRKLDLQTKKVLATVEDVNIDGRAFNVSRGELNKIKALMLETKASGLSTTENDNYKQLLNMQELSIESGRLNNFIFPVCENFSTSILTLIKPDTKIFFNNIKRTQEVIKSENEFMGKTFKSLYLEGKISRIFKKYFEINFNMALCQKGCSFISMQSLINANNLFNAEIFCSPKIIMQNYSVLKTTNLINEIINYYKQNYKILLIAKNEFIANNYIEIIAKNEIKCKFIDKINLNNENLILEEQIFITTGLATKSIIFADEKLAVISLNSDAIVSAGSVKTNFVETFKENDFVLHSNFGICRCDGIKKMAIGEIEKEYFVLIFAQGSKIYVPCENAELLSKYKGKEEDPRLSKLGSKEWEKTKIRVKESVKKLAFNLLELYKNRRVQKGFKFNADDDLQTIFEDKFKFVTTPSQQKAIDDVKADMQSTKVMDRLICGDTGYGKTEVALRACFKAILSGKQVAFLAPTTILAYQHFNTAKERMAEFGVEIELLNRFKTKKEQEKVLENLENGKCNLVIGTHRLLSEDVKFFDLGLLVLDEEQRFGVGHKEKIKNLKKNIDVLTLSATPIPRTLYLSLINIRDASIIDTPPVGRLPVSVNVLEWDESIALAAINKELERGGQVLIVYNNIEKLPAFTLNLKNKIGGDVVIDYAHARMNQTVLEEKVLNVYENRTQVLVSTTLIENGIDLPNANTLIVVEADKMGLSQLYQLKGRVGRSDRLAFAYFTYESGRFLTDVGYKRLNAINEFTNLGSGYQIAMRDLEIRGAGNILGAEQSGHLEKVGYDEYLKLLDESIKELNGEKIDSFKEVLLKVDLTAEIPSTIAPQMEDRIKIYKQLTGAKNETEILKVKTELETQFGNLPTEVLNLIKIVTLKNFATLAYLSEVKISRQNIVLSFYKENFELSETTLSKIANFETKAVLKFGALPMVIIEEDSKDISRKIDTAIKFIKNFLNLIC